MGLIFYYIAFNYFFNSIFHLWRIKEPKHFILGLLLFTYVFHNISYGLFFTGDIIYFPALYGIFPLLNTILIIFYFLYLTYVLEPSFYWKKIHIFLFAPVVVQLILYIRHFTLDSNIQLEIVQKALENNFSIYYPDQLSFIIHIVSMLCMYIYGGTLFLHKFKWGKVTGPKTVKVKFTIAIVIGWEAFVIFLDSLYVYNFYFSFEQSPWNPLLNYGSTFFFFVFLQFWPYYYLQGPVYFDSKTFGIEGFLRSYLDGVDLDELESTFNTLVYEQKVFKATDISLPKFARKMNITVHQLSEYLNRHLNTRFNDFIGLMRINESKKLLEEEKDKSIIEICFEVGFNSNSAFYKTFKKITGHTPKSWRNRT